MNRDEMRSVLTVALVVLVVVLALALLPLLTMPMMMGGGMMGGMMSGWNWGNWGGNMWWGWLLMLLFWVLLIGGVVALVAWSVRLVRPSGSGVGGRPGEALEILKQRYARGEITGEQFEQMKRDLAS